MITTYEFTPADIEAATLPGEPTAAIIEHAGRVFEFAYNVPLATWEIVSIAVPQPQPWEDQAVKAVVVVR